MKIENSLNQIPIYNTNDTSTTQNKNSGKNSADSFIDSGITVELSKRGLALAGELEPFLDTYETRCTLLRGVGHIGSENLITGKFVETLADNYQNELQRIKETYSGKEYDRQLAILEKAYEEACADTSADYVRQLQLLTGDIEIKPQTGISYSTKGEAERAYQENLEKEENREKVIDSSTAGSMRKEITNILLQLKNSNLYQGKKGNGIWGDFMSLADLKILGPSFCNRNDKIDVDGISDFSKSLLERYHTIISSKK